MEIEDDSEKQIPLYKISHIFTHKDYTQGVPLHMENLLVKNHLSNVNAKCITISPKETYYLEELFKEAYWLLSLYKFILVAEKTKTGRWHLHGVINMKESEAQIFQTVLTKAIGHSLITVDRPGLAWYCYMFKESGNYPIYMTDKLKPKIPADFK